MRKKIISEKISDIDVIIFDLDLTLYYNIEFADENARLCFQYIADSIGQTFEFVESKYKEIGSINLTLTYYNLTMDDCFTYANPKLDPYQYISTNKVLRKYLLGLKETGYKLAVATNNSIYMVPKVLDAIGIMDCFDYVTCAQSAGKGKPHPKMFNEILNYFGVLPAKVLSVGDNQRKDLDCATSVGITKGILVKGPTDLMNKLNSYLKNKD
ncbi:MAG: HAD-IA family hydrolase [Candidatus Margulisbacteria bacterium]|nr:HAD-IA family hydrolase [Candidatus Margulisiibacteriota bacterium]